MPSDTILDPVNTILAAAHKLDQAVHEIVTAGVKLRQHLEYTRMSAASLSAYGRAQFEQMNARVDAVILQLQGCRPAGVPVLHRPTTTRPPLTQTQSGPISGSDEKRPFLNVSARNPVIAVKKCRRMCRSSTASSSSEDPV